MNQLLGYLSTLLRSFHTLYSMCKWPLHSARKLSVHGESWFCTIVYARCTVNYSGKLCPNAAHIVHMGYATRAIPLSLRALVLCTTCGWEISHLALVVSTVFEVHCVLAKYRNIAVQCTSKLRDRIQSTVARSACKT